MLQEDHKIWGYLNSSFEWMQFITSQFYPELLGAESDLPGRSRFGELALILTWSHGSLFFVGQPELAPHNSPKNTCIVRAE